MILHDDHLRQFLDDMWISGYRNGKDFTIKNVVYVDLGTDDDSSLDDSNVIIRLLNEELIKQELILIMKYK